MKTKNLNIAKMISTFGIVGFLAGIVLLIFNEISMGAITSIVSVALSLYGFNTIKELNK